MSDIVSTYYQKLMDLAFGYRDKITVPTNFHSQVRVIDSLLNNDKTGVISTILEYMVHSANTEINLNSDNKKLESVLKKWKDEALNADVSSDIPRGLRSFSEQLFRERWKSSFLVIRIQWGKLDGFDVPIKMWLMDGGSVYAQKDGTAINETIYYFGKPTSKKSKELKNSNTSTVIIRKPYNQWYDKYPTPYLIRKGALYHALFKAKVLDRQAEIVETAFPYSFFLKMGSAEAMRKGIMPTKEEMEAMQEKFQNTKAESDTHEYSKGKIGAFPHDVNFEELIPDYKKALDDTILKSTDKNLLSALGLIELKGFSSNREEAILNPKVLVEEVEDAVKDYVEILNEIMYLVKERNKSKYSVNTKIRVKAEAISTFITDDMRTLIRSLYDRGLISKKSTIKNVTPLDFETQIHEREYESNEDIDEILYPQLVQNLENTLPNVPKDMNEEVPEDKNGPEADNYKNAMITSPFKSLRSIPKDIRNVLSKQKQKVFMTSFNQMFKTLEKADYDDSLKENFSLHYAYKKVKEYIQAPYDKNIDLPKNIKDVLPSKAQTIFRNAFNNALKSGKTEEQAFKIAWSAVKKQYKKDKDSKKWIKK